MSKNSVPRGSSVHNTPSVLRIHLRPETVRMYRRQISVDYGIIATRWPLRPCSYRVFLWLLTQRDTPNFRQQIAADALGYTQQAISKAFEELENHGLMHSYEGEVKFSENYGGAEYYNQMHYHTFETPLINEVYIQKCGGFTMARERVRAIFGDKAVEASLEDSIGEEATVIDDESELRDALRVDEEFEGYAPPSIPFQEFAEIEEVEYVTPRGDERTVTIYTVSPSSLYPVRRTSSLLRQRVAPRIS